MLGTSPPDLGHGDREDKDMGTGRRGGGTQTQKGLTENTAKLMQRPQKYPTITYLKLATVQLQIASFVANAWVGGGTFIWSPWH